MKKIILAMVMMGAAGLWAEEAPDAQGSVTAESWALDLRAMPRIVHAGEVENIIVSDPMWVGSDGATVKLNGAAVAPVSDGVYRWTAPETVDGSSRVWTATFTHESDAGTETATYHSDYWTVTADGVTTEHAAGSPVTTGAARSYGGYEFVRWEAEGVSLGDPNAAEAAFTMPEGNVALTALYQWAPEVTAITAEKLSDGRIAISVTVSGAAEGPARVTDATRSAAVSFMFTDAESGTATASTAAQVSGDLSVTGGGSYAFVWDAAADGAAVADGGVVKARLTQGGTMLNETATGAEIAAEPKPGDPNDPAVDPSVGPEAQGSETDDFWALDLRETPRIVNAGDVEKIVVTSPIWDGSAGATVTLDGAAVPADANGEYVWTVPATAGATVWTFTHTDAGGATLTAVFHSTQFEVSMPGGATEDVTCGETATIAAPEYAGYRFVRWDAAGVALGNTAANPAVFTMPAGDVTLTPVYEWAPEIALTATKGAADTVAVSATVAAAADPAPGRVEGPTAGTLRFEFERVTGTKTACATWVTAPGSFAVSAAAGETTVAGVWNLAADLGAGVTLTEAARMYAVIGTGAAEPVWTSTGSYPWTESNGTWTSGNKGVHSTTSTLSVTLTGPGTLTLDWSVSSESGYDKLTYSGDGNSTTQSGNYSTSVTVTVAAGQTKTLSWSYSKDSSVSSGEDRAYVKNIRWEGAADLVSVNCALAEVGYPFANEDADPDVVPEGAPEGTLSQYDVTEVFDGAAHTVDTNGLAQMVRDYGVEGAVVSFLQIGTGGAVPSRVEDIPADATWANTAPGYVDAGTYVVWYKVSKDGCRDYVHAARVIITKRPVRVMSDSATFYYDGKTHRHEVLITRAPDVSGEGFVGDDGVDVTFTADAQVTTPDEDVVQNAFTYTWKEGTKESNYAVTTVTGDLRVLPARNPFVGDKDVDVPNGSWDPTIGRISMFDTIDVYDATEKGLNAGLFAEVIANQVYAGVREDATVSFIRHTDWLAANAARGDEDVPAGDDPLWREEMPTWADAGTYVVWYKISAPHCEDYIKKAQVVINKRSVTLRSATGSFGYDGDGHEDHSLYVEGQGLAPTHEVVSRDWTAVTDVTAAAVENRFAYSIVDTVTAATLADEVVVRNYDIAVEYGTLTVTNAANPFVRGEMIDRDTPAGAVSTYDRVAVYDGTAQTIAVEKLLEDVEAAVYEALRLNGTWKVEYWSGTGGAVPSRVEEIPATEWQEDVPGFVNVGEYVVWYRVVDTAGNCAAWAHAAKVTVTKRTVTVTSRDGEWPWDGAEHSAAEVDVTGLVEGHTIAATEFASITEVGKAVNTFSVGEVLDADNESVTANYNMVTATGVLSVYNWDRTSRKNGVVVPMEWLTAQGLGTDADVDATDAGGLTLTDKYLLGLGKDDALELKVTRVRRDYAQIDAINVNPASGVRIATDEGEVLTGQLRWEGDFEFGEDAGVTYYTATLVDTSGSGFVLTVGNPQFGCVTVKSDAKSVLLSVPWMDWNDGAAATVAHLVVTNGMRRGEKIYRYDGGTRADGVWHQFTMGEHGLEGAATVTGAGVSAAEDAATTRVGRGSAFFLQRDAATAGEEIRLFGRVGAADTAAVTAAAGTAEAPVYSLMASARPEAVTIGDIGGTPAIGDEIVVPGAGGAARTWTWKALGAGECWTWRKAVTRETTVAGRTQKVVTFEDAAADARDVVAPAGMGWWYVSRGGAGEVR